MKTVRVMRLYAIRHNWLRRLVLVATLPLLTAANVILATFAAAMWSVQIQRDLFRSAAHYWRTSDRITDEAAP